MDSNRFLKVLCGATLSIVSLNVFADNANEVLTNPSTKSFYITPLFLQPGSNNLKYAVFVAGTQPTSQRWNDQEITPGYHPAFELGFNYGFAHSLYNVSIDWLHLNTTDSDSKQASQNTDPTTVQFVAPPYDVGPAVFGIKRADSKVNFNYNNVGLNVGRMFEYGSHVHGTLFGGLDVLNINQTLTTTFSDYRGSPQILAEAYALPADPQFYFQTQNTSKYLGAGPDIGFNVEYAADNGLGAVGQFMGTLTAGSMSTNDNFTSASARLMAQGITTSYQAITAPDVTQVVPGIDSKVGLFYHHSLKNTSDIKIEVGYRFAYFINAISEVSPDTLVQAKLDTLQPEFATGTMAVNSTTSKYSPFSLNGPYLTFALTVD